MKRVSILVVLTCVFLLAFSGVAFANFGIHGGYSLDTDACAGCHRAHTSFSELTWSNRFDPTIQQSALLVSSADTMTEFCNTCHGSDAPGASTNVVDGVFDSGPSGPDGMPVGGNNDGVTTLYMTNSTFDATLNGGGFSFVGTDTAPATSMHGMDATGTAWGMGASVSEAEVANLTCTSCHDVHGSSNYRLLKDSVNNKTVGGYLPDGTPQAFVISAEEGYPDASSDFGWLKHEAGALQMAAYRPNYTSPEYAYRPPLAGQFRSISTWCAACHESYVVRESAYDYGMDEAGGAAVTPTQNRHRHPVNISLAAGIGPGRSLMEEVVQSDILPLEAAGGANWYNDYMGCLTCHRAHGSAKTMEGWAEAALAQNAEGTWGPILEPGSGGVEPTKSSALLRADNRGVCERCHNK